MTQTFEAISEIVATVGLEYSNHSDVILILADNFWLMIYALNKYSD